MSVKPPETNLTALSVSESPYAEATSNHVFVSTTDYTAIKKIWASKPITEVPVHYITNKFEGIKIVKRRISR
jgi:hypothetical protein